MKDYVDFSEWRQYSEWRDPATGYGIKLTKRGRVVGTNHQARANNRLKRQEKAWPVYLQELYEWMKNGGKLDHYETQYLAREICNFDCREKAEIFLATQGWKLNEDGKWYDPKEQNRKATL